MKKFFLNSIGFYQKYLSFDNGFFKRLLNIENTCRFVPTCSQYAHQSIKKYGILSGGLKGLKRIVRCNPLCKGGIDPLV